jgi:hypothetical protein
MTAPKRWPVGWSHPFAIDRYRKPPRGNQFQMALLTSSEAGSTVSIQLGVN